MKIIILHGEDEDKSYQRLQVFIHEAKKRSWEVVNLERNNDLSEVLSYQSLFGKNRFFILEDVNIIKKKDFNWLTKNSQNIEGTLIIYQKGLLAKGTINKLPKPDKIEEYKLPKLIWNFLDSFYPGNLRNSLLLLHKITETEPVEMAFYFLIRHLRDLYWVKLNESLPPYPSWRIGKLKNQALKFKNKLLGKIISDFSKIDLKSKTSNYNIGNLLDFAIIRRLE